MPQPRKSLPRYLKHASGKGRIVWTDPSGTRREKLLPGAFNSPESLAAFARLQLELATNPAPAVRAAETGPTVVEILLPYLKHAAGYYGPGDEVRTIKSALKPARELYGLTPAADFGPRALAAVREAFVRAGWSRQYCNRQVGRVVRAFKWCAGEELIPATVYQALKTLAPLRRGKTTAPEAPPRMPANPEHVAATLPFLAPHARALVELLRVTGMRPGEACRMTLGQIDRVGSVWLYNPATHKNEHRGRHRTIALGETAQAVIVAHLGNRVLGPDEPLFSPARQREERYAAIRTARKSKVQPSQVSRRKRRPKKVPGERFTPVALCHAVHVACRKADARAKADAQARGEDPAKAGVPKWSPYQLRHLVAAELREKFTLEHVRAALGHSHASMSAHYAKGADLKLAEEVAAKAG